MKTTKREEYRKIIESLKREFYGGNYENFSCGNTMGLYVRNPYRCERLFERFERIKTRKAAKSRTESVTH